MNQKLDRTAIIAIAVCIALILLYQPLLHWLGWSRYVEPARTSRVVPRDTTLVAAPPSGMAPDTSAVRAAIPPAAGDTAAAPPRASLSATDLRAVAPALERTLAIETPLYRAEFSSRGARLTTVELKRYASAHGISSQGGHLPKHRRGEVVPAGDRVVLAGGPLFGLDLGSGATARSLANVVFATAESTDASGAVRAISFTLDDASGLHLRQTYRVRPDSYALDYTVEMSGIPESWRLGDYALTARSWPLLTEADLQSDMRALSATSLVGTNVHRERAGGLMRAPKRFDGNVRWAGVQSRYFLSAVAVREAIGRAVISSAERRPISPEALSALPAGTRPEQEFVSNVLQVGVPGELQPAHHFVLYVGPNEYFPLASLKAGFERAVDLGWAWLLPFSKALLQLLNWIYGLVHNYGVAIVLLATLVRVLLHPLNLSSMRSMRAMQKLQPEMTRLRQKYKNDPQALNAATMALYRENKVNPAGGCLPIVIQMPMFIALYSVLFNAIELRQAPFIGWMNDLSAPDLLFRVSSFPIRLLPVLMMGSGLLQQALTPTAPEQRPTMYIMNVVMLVFFYNLPSGLVLYWTVMNLLTAAQQWIVMRQDGAPEVVAQPAAAVAGGRKKGNR